MRCVLLATRIDEGAVRRFQRLHLASADIRSRNSAAVSTGTDTSIFGYDRCGEVVRAWNGLCASGTDGVQYALGRHMTATAADDEPRCRCFRVDRRQILPTKTLVRSHLLPAGALRTAPALDAARYHSCCASSDAVYVRRLVGAVSTCVFPAGAGWALVTAGASLGGRMAFHSRGSDERLPQSLPMEPVRRPLAVGPGRPEPFTGFGGSAPHLRAGTHCGTTGAVCCSAFAADTATDRRTTTTSAYWCWRGMTVAKGVPYEVKEFTRRRRAGPDRSAVPADARGDRCRHRRQSSATCCAATGHPAAGPAGETHAHDWRVG